MKYARCILPCVLLMSSCGGVDSDFSNSASQSIFDTTNNELHTLHLTALELENWPSSYSWDCQGGGIITMVTTYRGEESEENIDSLLHTLSDCIVGDRMLNGTMNYLDFNFLDCNGANGIAFDIEADIDVTGPDEGNCVINAREDCGKASGTTCGYEI